MLAEIFLLITKAPNEAIAPLLLAAIPYIYQGIAGYKQQQQGKDMASGNKRPTMVTPEQLKQNLNLAMQAKQRASIMGLPGENVTADRIQQSTQNNFQNMLNTGQDSASILAGLSSLDNAEKNAFVDLGVKGSEYKADNELVANSNLMNANTAMANQELNNFDYNKNQPYQNTAAAASALIGAGNQNINGAVTGLGNVAASAAADGENGGQGNRMPAETIPSAPVNVASAQPIPNNAPDNRTVIPPSTPYTAPQTPLVPPTQAPYQQQSPLQEQRYSNNDGNDAQIKSLMRRYPNTNIQQLQKAFPYLFK